MKIAIIAHTMFPIRKPFYGGLEMHTYLLTEQLIDRGHDVTLFAAKGSDPQLPVFEIIKPRAKYKPTTWQKIRGDMFFQKNKLKLSYYETMLAIKRGGFDVIHNNSLHSVPIKYADALSLPMLTVFHTPPIKEMKKAVAAKSRHPFHKFVTVSHNNASLWQEVTGHKPDVVYNGIQLEKWKYKTRTPTHTFAVWVGRIIPEKGLEYAIEACKKLGMDLKIIGPVADEAYFQKKIQPLFNKHVMYYGHLSHEIINHIVTSASVAVVSSVWEEPFGLVVAEALAAGTPVAGFRIGALPEIITPTVGELAQVGNVDDLAQAIQEASKKDPVKCRKSVEQRFSIKQMIDNYEAVYHTLLERNTQHTPELVPWSSGTI